MELNLIHFYPDLMSLYGSYGNIAVLRRCLETLGHTVTVTPVLPGESTDLPDADFLFMGAGTERAQRFAAADFVRYGDAVCAAAESDCAMLFCGTAMELLGRTVTAADGTVFDGIGLADFTSTQGKRRYVEDVYGHTDLFDAPIVGFMNKCSIIKGVETPLLTALDMGFGNAGAKTPEGFHYKNVFASCLTGPILAKNPRLLQAVAAAILRRRSAEVPAEIPVDNWAQQSYAVTEAALRQRLNG